jgi:hypothetical protein
MRSKMVWVLVLAMAFPLVGGFVNAGAAEPPPEPEDTLPYVPPTPPTPHTPPTTRPPKPPPLVPPRRPPLAVTGSDSEPLFWAGLASLVVGSVLVIGAQRRRNARQHTRGS